MADELTPPVIPTMNIVSIGGDRVREAILDVSVGRGAKMAIVPLEAGGNPSLRDRPILIQRGADFQRTQDEAPPAPLVPLETDGTVAGNGFVNGVKHMYHPPAAPAKVPPRVVKQAQAQTPPPPAPIQYEQPEVTETPMPASNRVAYTPPSLPATTAPPVQITATRPQPRPATRTKVVLTGGGFPSKITAYFHRVIVSANLVVLGFIDDGETSIIEPPITPEGVPPLVVTVGTEGYACQCYELSFKEGDMTYLVLPRAGD